MKLDRNLNRDGTGKYALVLMRNMPQDDGADRSAVRQALHVLAHHNMLDYGNVGAPSEFFLIRLKDKYAGAAIGAYADAVAADARKEPDEAASQDKFQWACEVQRLAGRAGDLSPFCKQPD